MKARPILFSGPMVRALLAGNKTQTRRIVKGYDIVRVGDRREFIARSPHPLTEKDSGGYAYVLLRDGMFLGIPCPYGKPGDLLWVRETWSEPTSLDPGPTFYLADYPACVPRQYENVPPAKGVKWKPSIHMRRDQSRLTLRITDVRVQRLQEISEEDAQSEGVDSDNADGIFYYVPGIEPHSLTAVEGGVVSRPRARCYGKLWEHIHGAGSWNANPWVWALSFEVIHANVDQVPATKQAA